MTEQLSMDIPKDLEKQPEKKPNPVWVKLNKIDEQINKLTKKIDIIEKSLRR